MESLVYILSGVTCLICTVLLFRGFRAKRIPLLLWSALCFSFLTLSNLLLFPDYIIYPDIDLSLIRGSLTLLGICMLLYGLIFETGV